MPRRCGFAPALPQPKHQCQLRNTGTITESFGNYVRVSRFPQGGSRMAERGRPRAFDKEEVIDVAMSLQQHDGKSWRSAVRLSAGTDPRPVQLAEQPPGTPTVLVHAPTCLR